MQHIKLAYDLGINTFDTANVYSNGVCKISHPLCFLDEDIILRFPPQESERILGKAIKQFNLPREEIVVMTKLCVPVGRDENSVASKPVEELEILRYTNQFGLSRKVR